MSTAWGLDCYIWLGIGIVGVLVTVALIIGAWKAAKKQYEGLGAALTVTGIIIGLVSLGFVLFSSTTLVKIKTAPKLYVIEHMLQSLRS